MSIRSLKNRVERSGSRALAIGAISASAVALGACAAPTDDSLSEESDALEVSPTALADQVTLAPAASGPGLLDAEEVNYVQALNAKRIQDGQRRLAVSIGLTRAAKAHAHDMAVHEFLDHQSSDGTSAEDRIAKYNSMPWDAVPGPEWGEDVGRSTSIAKGVDAFNFMRDGLAGKTPYGSGSRWPGSDRSAPNSEYSFTRVGVAGELSEGSGKTNWVVDYGNGFSSDPVLSLGIGSIASNGGFELGSLGPSAPWNRVKVLDKWSLYAGNQWASAERYKSSLHRTGNYALWLYGTSDASASATQLNVAAPGIRYGLDVYTMILDPGTGGSARMCDVGHVLILDFLDGNRKRIGHVQLSNDQLACSGDQWKKLSVKTTSPAGTKFARVVLFAPRGSQAAVYDDVRVTAE